MDGGKAAAPDINRRFIQPPRFDNPSPLIFGGFCRKLSGDGAEGNAMRILLLTRDPDTERRFASAAQGTNAWQITVLHSEAQALERLYRDPFDALLTDMRTGEPFPVLHSAPYCPRNRYCLLSNSACGTLPSAVICGFDPSCPPDTVLNRIRLLSNPQDKRRFGEESRISAALQSVGVPTHMQGFPLLKDAIRFVLRQNRPTALRMQEDVYAMLASAAHKSVSVVEHAMRRAIDAAWLRADARELERLFGYTVSAEKATPSNEAFIFQMCEHIGLMAREEIL